MTTDPSTAIEAMADAAKEIAKPLYEDALQPLAKETGQALGAAGSFVRMAVRPFQTFALGAHLSFDWLDGRLRTLFEGVPAEKVVEPPANIAGPLLLAAGFTSEAETELRARYAQLLASAMHADTKASVHPAFVEILRQLTDQEALLLEPLSKDNSHPVLRTGLITDGKASPRGVGLLATALANGLPMQPEAQVIAIENFQRLGLIEIEFEATLKDATRYQPINDGAIVRGWEANMPAHLKPTYVEGMLMVTQLGTRFLRSCLPLKDRRTTSS